MIGRDEADRVLVGLGAAHDRIAAAMYAIDVHPALDLLRRGSFTGTTQRRWLILRPEIDLLWAHFAVLGESLEQARAMRATGAPGERGWADLDRLLGEPAVALDADGMPLAAPGVAAEHVGLGELAQRLERRTASVAVQLSEVDGAWTAVVARVAQLSEAVRSVAALAADVGEPDAARQLREALASAEATDVADPLAAAPAGRVSGAAETRWVDLAGAVEKARTLVNDLVRLRDGFTERRASLSRLIEAVADAEDALVRAHARVAEKIADPGLAATPAAAALLRARAAELDGTKPHPPWRQIADDLAVLEASAHRAREHAERLRAQAEELLARRDELRGRLAAYRAKAGAHDLSEQESLADRYSRAHDLLFTAPCDLRASTRAVHDYQHTLAAALGATTRSDVDVDG